MIPELKITLEEKEKGAFYASDYGKTEADLWLSLTNTPKSNPVQWNETLKWGAGKGVEMQMLKVLKDSGIVPVEYVQEEHGRVDFEREGVVIHGYIDAKNIEGEPIEIKSINNKNSYDIKAYEEGNPKENYVGQLATYLEATGKEKGYLFAAAVDGLSYFWFECNKVGDSLYKCGNITLDIGKEYKRWKRIYDMVQAGQEPNWNECRYKVPLEEIDWKAQSKTAITDARMGRSVISDSWHIKYSPWKDLIIKKQGAQLGYSEEELEIIKAATEGYTTWKK